MPWKKLLAWATGKIDEALRQKLEFVLEENRVYRVLLDRHSPHWRLQDAERKVLAEKGKPLGKLLGEVITILRVRPKNSAETRWSIEPQGLLKDSPLCDDATPIAAHRGRRLDEPTPAGCDRIPPGRKSHSPGTTRWQTQALHRRPANPAGSESQARRSAPPGEISHPLHSRYPPLV